MKMKLSDFLLTVVKPGTMVEISFIMRKQELKFTGETCKAYIFAERFPGADWAMRDGEMHAREFGVEVKDNILKIELYGDITMTDD